MEGQTNWHGDKFWHFQRISSVERGKLKEVNSNQEDMLWKRWHQYSRDYVIFGNKKCKKGSYVENFH